MTIQKLLGLLFEHIEAGEITSFDVYDDIIEVDFGDHLHVIKLNQDLLKQYNKIFGYE